MDYQPTRELVSAHVVPDWFHDAKFGIFIHWGLYSVPAWAPQVGELHQVVEREGWAAWFARNPYAEWYMNSYQIDGGPTQVYHQQRYGADFAYRDFVPLFEEASAKWDPDEWADLFRQVQARYVVLTTKHHDGYLLWPSRTPNPFLDGYQSRRNLVGELTSAVRARDLRMGLYYSGGLDWTFNDKVIRDITDLPAGVPQSHQYVAYANAHWRELMERYQPVVLWNDIAYPAATDLNELFAEYYNAVPEGVINNRFRQRAGPPEPVDNHCDFETPEYTSYAEIRQTKWETCRGIGASFGYNHREGPEEHQSTENLVRMLVDIVSKNGNLLLNVGPAADGTIPDLQRERLEGLGRWLAVNGEAIFDTRPWIRAEGKTAAGVDVRFTKKGEDLYAILLGTPQGKDTVLQGIRAQAGTRIGLVGGGPLTWAQQGPDLRVELPESLGEAAAHGLCISPAPEPV